MEFNTIDPIGGELPEQRPSRFRSGKLRRGVYLLPTFFTVANMMCGYYAILSAFEGHISDFDNAAIAIGVAFLFDSLDGRVARAMGTHSDFGKELDSLADIISFGIAPAVLAYAWGVRAAAIGRCASGAGRLGCWVLLSGVLRVASGPLQHSGNGAQRQALLRWNAYAAGCVHGRVYRAFYRRHADSRCRAVGSLAAAFDGAWCDHDQHRALLQL
jgi:CDP-diacylglycerol--serine O-phosphatidyltransferase